MASKRMYAVSITESDDFLELTHSAQTLYFHLSQNADDDGFVIGHKRIMRYCGCDAEHLQELIENGFIITFPKAILITHWHINNNLQHYQSSNRNELFLLNFEEAKKLKIPYKIAEIDETQQKQRGNGLPLNPNEIGTDWGADKNRIDKNRLDKSEGDLDSLNDSDIILDEIVDNAWKRITGFYPSDKVNNQDKGYLEHEIATYHGELSYEKYADRVCEAIYNYCTSLKQSNNTFYCVLGNLFKPEKQRSKLEIELAKIQDFKLKKPSSVIEDKNIISLEDMAVLNVISFDWISDHREDEIATTYNEVLDICFKLYPKHEYLKEAYYNVFYWFLNLYESGKHACNELYYAIQNYCVYLKQGKVTCNTDFGYFIRYMASDYAGRTEYGIEYKELIKEDEVQK